MPLLWEDWRFEENSPCQQVDTVRPPRYVWKDRYKRDKAVDVSLAILISAAETGGFLAAEQSMIAIIKECVP